VVAVGPEGGWDADELAAAGSLLGLGPTVLRAETAAVAAGTLLCAFRAALIAPLA
jgi:16S rRNA U1498 N3-methylase RsmE